MKTFSPWQFTLFRIVLGTYLAIHFASLLPYAVELFGANGLIENPALNPTSGLFPNPLNLKLLDWAVHGFVAILTLCALAFTVGFRRSTMALVLWFGWTALFHRNNLIANPSLPYIGLLLVLCALIPKGEPLRFGKNVEKWEMPVWIFRCAWILMAAGYTFSGITKLVSPSWIDGTAIGYVIENPLARPGAMRDLMRQLPDFLIKGLTWGTLLAEIAFLPLAIWKKSRPWIWLSMILLHFGIILVVDFTDLSLGMLMIHAFTFDPSWMKERDGERILAFDGECLMCSGFVRFLAQEDTRKNICFTQLQSELGKKMISEAGVLEMSTVIVRYRDQSFVKSEAIRELFASLGGMWRIFAIAAGTVPIQVRDVCYDFIAQRRNHFFKNSSCDLPPKELSERLI